MSDVRLYLGRYLFPIRLLSMYVLYYYCVSFTMYYKDLYLQTTPFMQAQYYYDYYYIYYGIYRTDLELEIK